MSTQLPRLDQDQQRLAADHVHLVERVARTVFRSNRRLIDEFIGAGYIGLCLAAKSFDPTRGAKFETYATFRIAGEMRDTAREIWGRDAGTENARAPRYVTGMNSNVVSLDAAVSHHHDESTKTWADVAATANTPTDDHSDLVATIAEHRHELPDKVNLVLEEYYENGRTLAQIGELLGITESRASQLRTQGLKHLRRRLNVTVDERPALERILAELARDPKAYRDGRVVVRLARRTKFRPRSCDGMLRTLQEQGMVVRERDDVDRRRISMVSITDAGRAHLAQLAASGAA